MIIGIMILVAGINMITALLVLILERTQMIGILKALGSSDWSVRKVFLYNAMYLIGVGLFWGNIIGIGLLLIQKYGKVFKLKPRHLLRKRSSCLFELGLYFNLECRYISTLPFDAFDSFFYHFENFSGEGDSV